MPETTEPTASAGKGGAPRGNTNALKNGSRSYRLPIGLWPKGMKRQETNARQYRRELEAAVMQSAGEISLAAAHYIDECVGAELHMALCRQLLRTKMTEMPIPDIIRCSESVVRTRTARNRSFERLNIGRSTANTIAALYDVQDATDDDPATETSSADNSPANATPDAEPQPEQQT